MGGVRTSTEIPSIFFFNPFLSANILELRGRLFPESRYPGIKDTRHFQKFASNLAYRLKFAY